MKVNIRLSVDHDFGLICMTAEDPETHEIVESRFMDPDEMENLMNGLRAAQDELLRTGEPRITINIDEYLNH
jgi:hypothetical protein